MVASHPAWRGLEVAGASLADLRYNSANQRKPADWLAQRLSPRDEARMLRHLFHMAAACCLLAVSCAQTRPGDIGPRQEHHLPDATTPVNSGYHAFADMTAILQESAAHAGDAATLQSLATTAAGRDVWLLRIAAEGSQPPDQRPALLIVGGIDADRVV